MFWDLLNASLQAGVAAIHAVYNLLPASPLFIDSSTVAAMSGPLGYAAWAFPVVPALAILVLYVVGVVTWVVAVLVRQLVEAAIP